MKPTEREMPPQAWNTPSGVKTHLICVNPQTLVCNREVRIQ